MALKTVLTGGLAHRINTKRASRKDKAQVEQVIRDLTAILEAEQALGVAAPQIGIPLRIIVVRRGSTPFAVINPELHEIDSTYDEAVEGCLSYPGVHRAIRRPTSLRLRGYNRSWQRISLALDGQEARIAQHEVDHLNQTSILDRAAQQV